MTGSIKTTLAASAAVAAMFAVPAGAKAGTLSVMAGYGGTVPLLSSSSLTCPSSSEPSYTSFGGQAVLRTDPGGVSVGTSGIAVKCSNG